jgi:hypothetical protein
MLGRIIPIRFLHPRLPALFLAYTLSSITTMLLKLVFWLLFSAISTARDCPPGYALDTGSIPEDQTIHWVACGAESIPNLDCGKIKVPLDYTNSSPGVLTLTVARLRADPSVANGKSIIFNPGGPGESGLGSLTSDLVEWVLLMHLVILIDEIE